MGKVRVSHLEKTFNLGLIPLFMSPFDMADALCTVSSTRDITDVVDRLAKKGPFKAGMTELVNELSGFSEMKYGSKTKTMLKVKNNGTTFSAKDCQLLTFVGLALPFFEFYDFVTEYDLDDPKEAAKFRSLELARPKVPNLMYPILNRFYANTRKFDLAKYDDLRFDDFCKLIKSKGLVESMSEKELSAVFGLYLLTHLDPRTNFLSLFFAEHDADAWLEKFQWLKLVEPENFEKYKKLAMGSSYQILRICDLKPDNFYQPEEQLGVLVDRFGRAFNYVADEHDAEIKAAERQVSQLERTIKTQRENLDAAYTARDDALQKANALQIQLSAAPKSSFDPGEEYRKLEKEHKRVIAEKVRAEAQRDRVQKENGNLKDENKLRADEIAAQQKAITDLKNQVYSLENQIEESTRIPRLIKAFDGVKVLVVVGVPVAVAEYGRATKIFDSFEIKDQESCNGSIDSYDLVIGTRGLGHSHPAQRHNNFLFYNGRTGGFITFLYQRFVENGKKK